MKKLFIILFSGLLFAFGCAKEEDWNVRVNSQATIYIKSDPGGAQIYLFGKYTNKTTPDVLTYLADGDYQIALKKDGFLDTAFTVSIINQKSVTKSVTLNDNLVTKITYVFNPGPNFVNFIVEFNQYVQLKKIEFFMPSGNSGVTEPNVIYEDNKPQEFLWYQQAEKGVWRFHIYGIKLWSRNYLDQEYIVNVDY